MTTQPTTPAARCVCGDPIEWQNHPDGSGWIHSPGSDTRCLDARPAITPAPVDPALTQRIARVIDRLLDSGAVYALDEPERDRIAAAVLAELAPELAHTPLVCSDERHQAKVTALEAQVRRLNDLIDRLGPTEQQQRHRAERADTALTRVRDLHQPHNVMAAAEHGEPADCTTCGPGTWGPDGCPTTQALTSPAEEVSR